MGLLASDRDPSADPGVDFYRFANGGWLDANPIPAGYGAWGAFEEVGRRNEVILRELLERAAAEPVDDLDRLLGDAFAAGLDVAAIEAAGLEPIAPLLRAIEGAGDHEAVLALLPALHRWGIFALFGWGVTVDDDDPGRNLLWLSQAGLGLPDREHVLRRRPGRRGAAGGVRRACRGAARTRGRSRPSRRRRCSSSRRGSPPCT